MLLSEFSPFRTPLTCLTEGRGPELWLCLHLRQPGAELRAACAGRGGRHGAQLHQVRDRAVHDGGGGALHRGEDGAGGGAAAGHEPAVGHGAGRRGPEDNPVDPALEQ